MRGPLLMCWQLTISVAQIMAAGINRGMVNIDTTFAYRFPIGFQLFFPVLVFLGIWFVPESPRWLLRKGQTDKATRNLQTLHREDKTYDPEPDVQLIQAGLDKEMELAAEGGWMQLITDPVERRKVIYSAGALIAQQVGLTLTLRHCEGVVIDGL
jgi:SP family sugar:H+ symporter-like MFS transporter